jgi:hypothetical protein
MHITINLDKSYLDEVNGTLTLEIYKNWEDKFGEYTRLIASIPGIPIFQARAMQDAVKRAKDHGTNILTFKPTLVVDNVS